MPCLHERRGCMTAFHPQLSRWFLIWERSCWVRGRDTENLLKWAVDEEGAEYEPRIATKSVERMASRSRSERLPLCVARRRWMQLVSGWRCGSAKRLSFLPRVTRKGRRKPTRKTKFHHRPRFERGQKKTCLPSPHNRRWGQLIGESSVCHSLTDARWPSGRH